MTTFLRFLLAAATVACLAAAQAAPAGAAEGDLVRSFSGDGRVVTDLHSGSRDELVAAQFVSGGGLLVAGSSIKRPYGVRMALTSDQYGAIVVAGSHRGGAPHSGDLAVARLLGDGRPDPEFGNGDGVVSLPIRMQVGGVKPGLNGRIVVAGTLRESGGVDFVAVQLLRDGSLDPAFGDAGVVRVDLAPGGADRVADLIVDPLDRLVLAGGAWPPQRGAARRIGSFGLVRLQPDGSPDRSLRHSGKAVIRMTASGAFATAAISDHSGRLVLGGMASPRLAFTALRDDGRLDTAFGRGGRAFVDVRRGYRLSDIAPERRGRILAALGDPRLSSRATGDMVALRLGQNGRPDRSFGGDGRVSTGFGRWPAMASVVVQNHDGQFVLAGTARDPAGGDTDFAIARYFGGG